MYLTVCGMMVRQVHDQDWGWAATAGQNDGGAIVTREGLHPLATRICMGVAHVNVRGVACVCVCVCVCV